MHAERHMSAHPLLRSPFSHSPPLPPSPACLQSLASHRFQAGFTALMRLALKALPASAVDAAVTASAAWVHGTAPDQVTAAQLTAEL